VDEVCLLNLYQLLHSLLLGYDELLNGHAVRQDGSIRGPINEESASNRRAERQPETSPRSDAAVLWTKPPALHRTWRAQLHQAKTIL